MKIPSSAKMLLRCFASCLILLAFAGQVHAATCTSTATGGLWATAGTWLAGCGAGGPVAGDTVTIATTGANSVVIGSNANAATITVNAGSILTIGNSATARAVVVTGNINVAGTFSVGATAATHTLSIAGDMANTGTVNFAPSGTRVCNVTFNKNGNQTVGGTGATYVFNSVTLNMGATKANILDITATSFTLSATGFVAITNGTFKIDANIPTLAPFENAPMPLGAPDYYLIPLTGGFWLNSNTTVNMATTTSFNVSVDGTFRISSGTINLGRASDDRLRMRDTGGLALIQVDGGALNITGRLSSVTATDDGTFTQSGGVITVGTIGNTIATFGPFFLGSGTVFNMSGGSIIIEEPSNPVTTANAYDVRAPTSTVTGGLIQIGDAGTTAAGPVPTFNISSVAPVWNFVVSGTNNPSAVLLLPLAVKNDVTINTGGILNANAAANTITIGAGNAGGIWTNNGTFTPSTSGVTFAGSGAASIGGTTATTFNKLTIGKAPNTSVTINTTPTITNTLTFTTGKIITGANRVIVDTAGTIATPSASSYVVGSFQKNYLAGANLNYFAGTGYPVGDATNYTPVDVSAGVTSTAGSLTVSTVATDHPQVTTPIASTGIDAASSVNRYWRFNNSGLTLTTNITATYNFVAADIDGGAATASFIVERYDGTNWNPTTIGALTGTSTQASNITLSAGNNDFAIGNSMSGFNVYPGAFNVFESQTPANSVLGRIYTKIVGASITLDVVAVNAARSGPNAAYSTNPITVAVLDTRDNTGAVTLGTNCRTWATIISTQALSPAWAGGRATITITAPANAGRDVRVRVTQGANVGCSTDRFAIRPTAFTSINSDMIHSASPPARKTGQNFTLTAATGMTGYDNGAGATLAVPALIPLIDQTQIVGTPNAGTIGGAFGNASGGSVTGAAFYYSEVGDIGLNASTTAAAIYDSAFTAVDSPNDCTADFSNVLVGNAVNGFKYGCKFGNTAVAFGSASGFGRFIPDNFSVALTTPPVLGATCGAFSYVGQPFVYTTAPVMTVTARNGTTNGLLNATTTNYGGSYMKLTNTTLTPSTFAGRYTRFDALGGGTTPVLATTSGAGIAPDTTVDPVIAFPGGAGTTGVGTLTFGSGAGFVFTRTGTPAAPFNADIALSVNVIDSDGVTYASNPASFGAATAGNGMAFGGGNEGMRYGQLRISNNNGSELLPLQVGVEVQYWTGTGYATNTLDNCTSIAAANFVQAAGPGAAITTTITGGGTMASGTGIITLTKPSPTPAAKGSVLLTPAATISGYLPIAPGGGRETFGVFKSGRIIHLREIY